MIWVYRVQDKEGRGPFRPGFSQTWADKYLAPGQPDLPTWGAEFGWDLIDRRGHANEHFGTAVRTVAEISRWFSVAEQERLDGLGFNIVRLRVNRILAESSNQLVFARNRPNRKGALIVPWLKGKVA